MKSKFYLLLPVMALASCAGPDLSFIDDAGGETTVRVIARAASDATLIYPVHIYAFDEHGKSCAHQLIASASQPLNLGVPRNADLHIVAVSADEDSYDLPATPTTQSSITLRAPKTDHPLATGYSIGSPLMMGKADIHTGDTKGATLNLSLNYAVASLTFNFYDLPAASSSVLVNVDKPFGGVNFDGSHPETTGTTRILCTPTTAGTCTSGEVYMFPTAGPETVFTISYNHDGEQYSTATYAAPLRAGVPYVVNGTYQDGSLHLSGAITPPEWATPTVLNFTMSDGSNTDITSEGGTSSGDTPTVNDVPKAFTVWENHVVISVAESTTTPGAYDLMLISRADREGVPSAFNESGSYSAADYAEVYVEDGLDGWAIPTEAQARQLYSIYNQHSDALAAAIQSAGADPVYTIDESGKNVRYLCENAEKTFSFKTNSILAAGKTVKDYHLRLVRNVTIRTR